LLKLIQNEWMKLWAKKGSWIMLVLILLIALFPSAIEQLTDLNDYEEDPNWKTSLQADIDNNKEILKESPEDAAFYEERIAIGEYRLANDLAPNDGQTTESYIEYGVSLISIISFFAVIIGASIVSNEFSTGTIKMLLTRPVSRAKILTSKLLTVFLYGIVLYIAAVFLSYIVGVVVYDGTTEPTLVYENGKVIEKSFIADVAYTGLLMSADFIMTILFAFMIGSVFRSSSLAIGLTLIISFMTALIVGFFNRYEFVKYIWITHSNLTQHKNGVLLVEGITMQMSLIVLGVYAVIFTAISYLVFMKRDITA
jgi:ABC-2 type transport system permease protein